MSFILYNLTNLEHTYVRAGILLMDIRLIIKEKVSVVQDLADGVGGQSQELIS